MNLINCVLTLVPQQEVENGYLQEIANRNGYVMTACDWWGMSKYDVPVIVEMMAADISDFVIIPDRLTQGMVNALLLMRLLKVNITFNNKFSASTVLSSLTLLHLDVCCRAGLLLTLLLPSMGFQ